ncbi:hypothetical protein EV175_003454 [Coemansia sp. RSA 1933]|nr:hypothetical protein EV175_003454 [Coemansia sp. RSA 1933]
MARDCTCSLHIKDIYVPLDYYTKVSRGFGYVEFYERADAEAAYDQRNEILVQGRPVSIEFARGQRKTSREMRHGES